MTPKERNERKVKFALFLQQRLRRTLTLGDLTMPAKQLYNKILKYFSKPVATAKKAPLCLNLKILSRGPIGTCEVRNSIIAAYGLRVPTEAEWKIIELDEPNEALLFEPLLQRIAIQPIPPPPTGLQTLQFAAETVSKATTKVSSKSKASPKVASKATQSKSKSKSTTKLASKATKAKSKAITKAASKATKSKVASKAKCFKGLLLPTAAPYSKNQRYVRKMQFILALGGMVQRILTIQDLGDEHKSLYCKALKLAHPDIQLPLVDSPLRLDLDLLGNGSRELSVALIRTYGLRQPSKVIILSYTSFNFFIPSSLLTFLCVVALVYPQIEWDRIMVSDPDFNGLLAVLRK